MKAAILVGWEDVPHISKERQESMLKSIPPWQRQARSKGIPQLGAGAIYQIPEEEIRIAPFPIPAHWPRSFALDVGWKRTAALWLARDPDSGKCVQYDEYYRGEAEPSVHASAIRARGDWIPGVVDPAARGRSQKDGEKLMELYQQLGLDLRIADNTREAGLSKVWEMLSQGLLQIFSTCSNTFNEYRIYHRNERGEIVKRDDHLMDCLRYNVMSGLARGKVEPTRDPSGMPWWYCPVGVFPG